MQAGAVVTVAFPPRYERTLVTVVLVGKTRSLVELPNGSQTWVTDRDLKRWAADARVA